MYQRILLPVDDGTDVDAVLDGVCDLATQHDATIYVLNVADTSMMSLTTTEAGISDVLETRGDAIVSEVAARLRDRNVDAVTTVRQGDPAPTIVEYADAEDIDLVLLPTHGRSGVRRLVLGSVTEYVVRHITVPVIAVPPDATLSVPFDTILVPTDGSDVAMAAIESAAELATDADADLHLLHVMDTVSLGPDLGSYVDIDRLEALSQHVIDRATKAARDAGSTPVASETVFGTPHHEIGDYADEHDVDLVVMGTHGHTGIDRYLLGSTTAKVLRTAPSPVLTVHDPDSE